MNKTENHSRAAYLAPLSKVLAWVPEEAPLLAGSPFTGQPVDPLIPVTDEPWDPLTSLSPLSL